MSPFDRHRLRFGPYTTPRFRCGQRVECEVRGVVIVAGLKDTPVPWPVARLPGLSSRGLVVFKGLAKAVRLESATAVCHHWRVTPQTVTRWRNQLGVEANTAGTRELRRDHGKRNFPKVKPKLWSKTHDPERAAKIAAAKRGKPRPPEVIEAMRAANLGRKLSAKHRRKLSEAQKRRHAEHPRADQWTGAEDAIVRTCSTDEAARRTGRSLKAVQLRRHRLGVPDGRRRRQ